MWMLGYSILAHLAFVVALPWLSLRAWRKGKFAQGMGERFGKLEGPWVGEAAGKRPIWIHAVSVGEAQMLPPVLARLKERFPDVPVVISTNTVTGQDIAKGFAEVAGTFYIPIDFGWAVRKLLVTLRPRLLVIMETEIWPNLIVQSDRAGVPVVFLNGRISDSSFGGYLKAKWFMKRVLARVTAFGMRSNVDAERIVEIGAASERVRVTGNLKYESADALCHEEEGLTRKKFGIGQEEIVLIGGSTFPGEEAMLLRVYQACLEDHPSARLILAPRHPQRFEEALTAIESAGLPVAQRSHGQLPETRDLPKPVILLDVMGELKRVYGLVDLVFIGKSMRLSPKGNGGQNPLEAAAWSKPILFGPSMENFQEVADSLTAKGGTVVVENEEDLLNEIRDLLSNSERRASMGERARSVIQDSLGAADRCMEILEEALKG